MHGSVFQRQSDGRWVAQVSVGPRGSRQITRRYAKSREEAEARLAGLQSLVPTDADRFWAQVETGPGCWPWKGTTMNGYGYVQFDGVRWRAPRYAYTLVHGPIPEGLHVLHSCDNPPCVRPDHLRLGTASDNMRDMVARGRAAHQRAG